MSKIRWVLLLFIFFVLIGSAYELRVWEDLDGNQFEGRFVKEMFGKLTVEAEDGSTKTFELEKLSELDQKYLRVKVPPKMAVDVQTQHNSIAPRPMTRIKREIILDAYQATVLIAKKSQRPFTSRTSSASLTSR